PSSPPPDYSSFPPRRSSDLREGGPPDAARRLLALAALPVLPAVELLDRGRRGGAGHPETLPARDRDPRPHPSAAHQPHRQHPVPDRKSIRLNSSHQITSYAV